MIVTASVNWQAVEAIGVVSTVVVALALASWPAIRARQTRPKLTMRVSSVEPHCIAIAGDHGIAHEVILRVEVHNEGKRAARRVTAKVTDMWIKDLPVEIDEFDPLGVRPYTTDDWRLRQSEPIALRWASSPPVTIASKASEFVSLVALRSQDNELTLCTEHPELSLFSPKFDQRLGRHRLRIFVFAENGDPMTEVIEFVIDGKNFIGAVGITSAPGEAKDTRLLTLLRELHSDD